MAEKKRRSRRGREGPPPDPQSVALGRAIKVLRTERGLSRTELAERSGLSYPFLAEVENGRKRPSSRTLDRLAEALGMRAHELLAATEWRLGPAAAMDTASMSPVRRSWFDGSADVVAEMAAPAGARSDPRSAFIELLGRLSDDDVERLLDLARRLAR